MAKLKGKVAWITGAGTGIGEAAALALAEEGAHIVLTGRRAEPIAAVAAKVKAKGVVAVEEPLDVADRSAVEGAGRRLLGRFGRVDILVNNAGINVNQRRWKEMTPADWHHVVDVNLNGAAYCCFAVLPTMRAQKDGLIINVSSWAGHFVSYVAGAVYGASKAAMLNMNEHLNIEEGPNGIRACCICPGEVATPILDKRPVPVTADDRARILQPEDLGETIRFVATMPARACLNEILISPTYNRTYRRWQGLPEKGA
jgi:NADP-dependent 3-hydroxy acid dehydrogenase YdfG